MRRTKPTILAIVLVTAALLTGCHRLGLAKSPPKKPKSSAEASATSTAAGSKAATTTVSQTYTIAVQNGGGIKGRGAAMVDKLKSLGILANGKAVNAKLRYPKTLVVYATGHQADAQQVQQAIGIGTVKAAPKSLKITTDVLVILGKDF